MGFDVRSLNAPAVGGPITLTFFIADFIVNPTVVQSFRATCILIFFSVGVLIQISVVLVSGVLLLCGEMRLANESYRLF